MTIPKAFLFDLNGTMINDMPYHIKAWHTILNNLGANLTMDEMKAQCYGKNQELIQRIFRDRFTQIEMDEMSLAKEKAYQHAFKPHLKLIEGLEEFLEHAAMQGIPMAIGSAAIMYNINFVIDGTGIRKYFTALVSAESVHESKPNPETFLLCAAELNVLAKDCLVFEDTPKGVEAAANAGMQAVVITTLHHLHEFDAFTNVVGFANDFTNLWPQLFNKTLQPVIQ